MISSLQSPTGTIRDPRQIQEHVYDYYRELLGSETPRHLGLASNTWADESCVSSVENEAIILTFTETELETIVMEMKTNTAPGPDGFLVSERTRCRLEGGVVNRRFKTFTLRA